MSMAIRKIAVAGFVVGVLAMANAAVVARWLEEIGVIPWAQRIREAYLSGPTLTVVVVLLILSPSGTAVALHVRRCRVCSCLMLRRGTYCCRCGSRV
ncbi:MAG: hypothetical protein J5J06_05685 [Phycisphaerae bacterium]|nr:hypothetical protein [Phycisphaerae bacterium]